MWTYFFAPALPCKLQPCRGTDPSQPTIITQVQTPHLQALAWTREAELVRCKPEIVSLPRTWLSLKMFFFRSTILRPPLAVSVPMSPVWNQPSASTTFGMCKRAGRFCGGD